MKFSSEKLETNNTLKYIRDLYSRVSDFKKGYRPRTNVVKDENGNLVTHCHSILAGWRNHFSQLLNVHGVNVSQTEIHAAEPLVPESSASEVELAIEKLKSFKSPGLIKSQQGVEQFALRSVNLLILF